MENWSEVEFILLKVLDLQPSELDRMEFWRAETLMDNLKKFNEEENNRRKAEEDKQAPSVDAASQANSMMKSAQNSLPKMPSFSMPNMSGFKI